MKTRWKLIMALLGAAGMAQASFVTIGDPGNTWDPSNGRGAVGYTYQIGKYEVTIAQFEASGAGNGNENYWNDGTRTVGTNAPASRVSLYEAMKYCNWLTSGDVNNGAYVFSGGVYQSTDRASAITTYGTIYALPTEDEWYKAAYWTGSGYSLYANGTDTAPIWGTTEGWNYWDSVNGSLNGMPNYTWAVGSGGVEQNGTYDMMGNVFEWVESVNTIRGGYHGSTVSVLSSPVSGAVIPSNEYLDSGFRIVSVDVIPEPATALILVIGGGLIGFYRRFFGRV